MSSLPADGSAEDETERALERGVPEGVARPPPGGTAARGCCRGAPRRPSRRTAGAARPRAPAGALGARAPGPSVRANITIAHRLGRGAIHRAGQRVGHQGVVDGPDGVVDREPAHPLASAAERSAGAQLGRRSSIRASAPPAGVSTSANRSSTTRMPAARAGSVAASHSRATSVRKSRCASSVGAGLGEDLVPPVAVDPDRRGRDQHPGRPLEPGECLAQEPGADRAALADPPAPLVGPSGADRLAGQMHHRVQPLEARGVHPAGLVSPTRSRPAPPAAAPAGDLVAAGR